MQLLVSVRSVDEARAALEGGASLIDVKEPRRGPLGRATDETISAVMRQVGRYVPVSAAMGEFLEEPDVPLLNGLTFIKWGLAGCRFRNWQDRLLKAERDLERFHPACKPVAVAYADAKHAGAPEPEVVVDFALQNHWKAVLLDTFQKDGKTLLDWLSLPRLKRICRSCRTAGTAIALAGSLGAEHVAILSELQPTWLAVRGAVCRRGRRDGNIDNLAVRRLVKALDFHAPIAQSSATAD
ncbi:MAG: (5-formylfuran-3-yl)methyl phosphate synthase [Gemmataceae bacterium]